MCKCCHCCSFDSLGCRLRTLKVFGTFLFLFGAVFALGGIAIGFLSDLYFHLVSLPDVFTDYILFAYLVVTTGVVALGTGLTAIYVAKTMTDDDCSTRGLAVLALLTIVCSLASVGVPAWPLYENGYFAGIPPQTTVNMTTAPGTALATTAPLPTTEPVTTVPATTVPVTTVPSTTVMTTLPGSSNSTATNGTTSVDGNSTVSNATSGGSNVTSPNATSPNVTSPNGTSENSTVSTSPPDNNTTVTAEPAITTGNSTESSVTREPIDFDEWFLIITPFGIICLFAFVFVLFGMFIFCIACCCPERSEIVDDVDLYKS